MDVNAATQWAVHPCRRQPPEVAAQIALVSCGCSIDLSKGLAVCDNSLEDGPTLDMGSSSSLEVYIYTSSGRLVLLSKPFP